jgi:amino acid adenylation domain-containing protein
VNPPERSIADVFRATAARHADRIAVEDEETRLSYEELRTRVDAIAATLGSRIPRPHQHVALLVDPGADAVASIFGVLSAGHAYVPLDPADPPSRLEFMLRDSAAATIVAGDAYRDLAERLAGDHCQVVSVDEAVLGGGSANHVPPDRDTVGLLMYTSGSTGQPKGVMQTHRNLLHYARNYSGFLGVEPGDRLSMLYSLSFAASSMDIYGALLTGATLCFLNVRRRGVVRLAQWIEEQRITVLHTVPTLYRHMLEQGAGRSGFPSVRAIDLGGEPVLLRDLELGRAHFRPGCLLVNHLAATELSVMAQHVLEAADDRQGTLPVGRAAPGVLFRILGEDGLPAAPDEPGEIVIHSPFLSAGYWQRPELTAAAFADDPERPGWRTYRSGDMGAMTQDGILYALGRKGAVVKIRGHSVHLSEVEAALRQIRGVEDAAVVAVADGRSPGSGSQLVAYVVGQAVDRIMLRRGLAESLPQYARPSEVHLIDALPRTASGKLDRRALASADRPVPVAFIDPPADAAERDVAALFARLLNLSEVGRDQDFFELGGDSLRFAKLQVELEYRLGHQLTPEDMLRDSTVAGVALLLHRPAVKADGHRPASVLVPMRASGSRTPVFFVHGGGGQAETSRFFLDALGEDRPVYGFQAKGRGAAGPPHRNLVEMAADYVAAMRRVQPDGPYYIGSACAGAFIVHEMACQLQTAGQSLAPLLLIDPPWPVRRRGPVRFLVKLSALWVATLMERFGETRSVLAWVRRRRRKAAVPGEAWPQEHMHMWIAFRIAVYRHRLGVYDGPVHVIANRRRIAGFRAGAWKEHLTGEIELFEVGRGHKEIFDASNEQVAACLRLCVERAQASLAGRLPDTAPDQSRALSV